MISQPYDTIWQGFSDHNAPDVTLSTLNPKDPREESAIVKRMGMRPDEIVVHYPTITLAVGRVKRAGIYGKKQ